MRVAEALHGSFLPSAEAEVLLAHVLRESRVWLLAHPEQLLSEHSWTAFMHCVERRRKHEPVAYIVGEQEFFGRSFVVDTRVLIPRPSTEGIVRAALRFLDMPADGSEEVDASIVVKCHLHRRTGRSIQTIVDVGTGSGCIAITLALERPDLMVIATDVSADALEVARANAKRHGVTIDLRQGSDLEAVRDLTEPFLLVSNPPYIPSGNDLMPDVREYEPHVALFGGERGDEIVRSLTVAAEAHPFCSGWIVECPANPSPSPTSHGTVPA